MNKSIIRITPVDPATFTKPAEHYVCKGPHSWSTGPHGSPTPYRQTCRNCPAEKINVGAKLGG